MNSAVMNPATPANNGTNRRHALRVHAEVSGTGILTSPGGPYRIREAASFPH